MRELHYNAEIVSLLMLIICGMIILVKFRMLGLLGLYLYNAVAIIASNIQVLQVSDFHIFNEKMALGTIVFATSFLVSDMIAEHYGVEAARKNIYVCFAAQISFVLIMFISCLYNPSSGYENIAQAFDIIFTPAIKILIASIIAYASGQYYDIIIFKKIRDFTGSNFLWFRTISSTAISGFIDNFVFSYIAWILLSSEPITIEELFKIYIFASYFSRITVNILTTPIIYISYFVKPKSEKNV